LRGSRPRSWAKADDLDSLRVGRAQRDRFTLGRLNGHLLAADSEAHVALIAPTRSGKTTRYVIPWLLEHDGPAIVTSTKTDVLDATRRWRAKHGEVSVWNPFGTNSMCWTPLAGCESWQASLSQARWLADAAQEGDSEIATYWRGEAARLLAPLLHAAAIAKGNIAHVLDWIDSHNTATPGDVLKSRSPAAYRQLAGIAALDPRNRGTIYMSAGSLLAAYRMPAVQAAAKHGFTPAEFLNGKPNTLYLIASSRDQRLLAPHLVAIVSGILHEAAERANSGRPLTPTLRVLLDETANIAPLRDLPAHLSQAAGHGVRIATIWQSLAQAEHRYDRAADEILANSTAKIYLGPVTDSVTREHITDLLGEEPIDTASLTVDASSRSQTASRTWRAKATASALQQLEHDRALLVEGRNRPALIETKAWWEQPRLRRRGR
jgi:type IV secretory pathway TraG/TraD family ATPase VirD4